MSSKRSMDHDEESAQSLLARLFATNKSDFAIGGLSGSFAITNGSLKLVPSTGRSYVIEGKDVSFRFEVENGIEERASSAGRAVSDDVFGLSSPMDEGREEEEEEDFPAEFSLAQPNVGDIHAADASSLDMSAGLGVGGVGVDPPSPAYLGLERSPGALRTPRAGTKRAGSPRESVGKRARALESPEVEEMVRRALEAAAAVESDVSGSWDGILLEGGEVGSRWGHVAVSVGSRVVVHGGEREAGDESSRIGTTAVLEDGVWRELKEGTRPRVWHALAVVNDGCALCFGGDDKGGLLALDTRLNLWFPPETTGRCPAGRVGHSFVGVGGNRAVLFGGLRGGKWTNDVTELNTQTYRWSKRKVTGEIPQPRCYHACVALGDDRMVVIGGNDETTTLGDVAVLDLSSDVWVWSKPICIGSPPCPRTGLSATLISDRHILVLGGWDPDLCPDGIPKPFADAFILDTSSWEWTQLDIPSSLAPKIRRTGHIALHLPSLPPSLSKSRTLPPGQPAILLHGGLDNDRVVRSDTLILPIPPLPSSSSPISQKPTAAPLGGSAIRPNPVSRTKEEHSSQKIEAETVSP